MFSFCFLIQCTLIKKCVSLFSLCRGAGKPGRSEGQQSWTFYSLQFTFNWRLLRLCGAHALNILIHYHTLKGRWPRPYIDLASLNWSGEDVIGGGDISTNACTLLPYTATRYTDLNAWTHTYTHTHMHARHQMPPQLYCWLFAFKGCQLG